MSALSIYLSEATHGGRDSGAPFWSSDLEARRPIWFGGDDRSEKGMDEFFAFLCEESSKNIAVAVMDMWKPFRNPTSRNAPQASILFDKFHIIRHLGEALDKVRK